MIGQKTNVTLLILVVLYKEEILSSSTINSIKYQLELGGNIETKLVIWDNSPQPASEKEQDHAREILGKFDYVSTCENVWLSKVYNRIVSNYDFDYILLLDQDSHLPLDYLMKFFSYVEQNINIKLFLPIVKDGELLVSPGDFWIFKGKHWIKEKKGLLRSKNIVALTSGMFISKKYFLNHSYQFDERLSLYGIDTKFMLDYSKNENELFVMDVCINHKTTLWSNPSVEIMLPRFINFRKAYSIFLSDNILGWTLTCIHTLYLCIKLTLKYKDLRFLFWNRKE